MHVKIIDQPFLLNAFSLTLHERKRIHPVVLVDHRLKETVFVMVKEYRPVENNKYEVKLWKKLM